MRALASSAPLLFLLLAGCPHTDTAVFVAASIEAPAVTVTGGSLGSNVKGSFELHLHLGARASGPSSVQLTSFSIVDAASAPIVSPLELTADRTLPVTVAQDSDEVVKLTFDTGADPLPMDVKTKLCAGMISIRGAIDDSLENTPTGVDSVPFSATCM